MRTLCQCFNNGSEPMCNTHAARSFVLESARRRPGLIGLLDKDNIPPLFDAYTAYEEATRQVLEVWTKEQRVRHIAWDFHGKRIPLSTNMARKEEDTHLVWDEDWFIRTGETWRELFIAIEGRYLRKVIQFSNLQRPTEMRHHAYDS